MGNETTKKNDLKEDIIPTVTIYPGNIPGKKKKMDLTNQDVFFIGKDLPKNVHYFAVYDGHGEKGREAADGLRTEVESYINSKKNKISKFKTTEEVETFFKNMYKKIQTRLSGNNDYNLSGTCAISVLIVNNKMFAINLGDSRCVLGQRRGDEIKSEKVSIEMSIDQKPTRVDESKRIQERGGEVSEKIAGPPRVFRKNDDVPGLAVARSIGDIVAHEVGVSCEPEVIEKEFEQTDEFIIIGSDGIWDAMSSIEAVGYVFQKKESLKEDDIAQSLAKECRNRWEVLNSYKQKYISEINSIDGGSKDKNNQSQHEIDIDDITCVIAFLRMQNEDYPL